MIDFEAVLIKLYPDADGMRRLIELGLKDENVELLGEDALKTWRSAKSWYQRKGKPIPMAVLLEDHEAYVRIKQEQGEEEIDPEPSWLVKSLQVRYLQTAYRSRMLDAEDDGTFDVNKTYEESLELTKSLSRDLLRITTNSTSDKPLEPMSANLPEFIEDTLSWEERVEAGEVKRPVTFGFDKVDDTYKGIRQGEIAVLAAYTKIGKSFILCKMALKAAIDGNKVALWTLENSEEETYARLTALAGELSYDHVSNKTLWPGEERDTFRGLVGQDVFDRLHVKQPQSQASATLDEMYWESYDAGIDLFVGDQLSHVYYPSERKGDPDWLNEGQKLLTARRLSKETHMASVWAAQLNVKAAKKDDLDSTMMARSQGIVQGADFVFYVSDPTKGTGNVRKLSCSTSRRGPKMDWELIFDYSPLKIEAVRVI